jgi:hypothetical protein
MNEKNMNIREMKTGTERRWRRDADGSFHYHGRCPFNNAVCRMLNRVAGAGRGR